MTDTDTAAPAEVAEPRSGAAYLPVLPAGWHYTLALVGPDAQKIDVRADDDPGVPGGYVMVVETGTGALDPVQAGSLAEAAKMGVKAVKALAVVRTHRAAALRAEEQFRAAIGRPTPNGFDNGEGGRTPFAPGGQLPSARSAGRTAEPAPEPTNDATTES
jgi:hypothetical protein